LLYFLFALYLVIFCWLLTRIKFFKKSELGNYFLIGLFLIRIIVALVNGYISMYYYPATDISKFQLEGIAEYELLFRHPVEYLTNMFQNGHSNGYGNFLESSNSFWNDTRSNLIIKMLSIFDIFSRSNFFINALFYNFLVFFGPVALYRVFIKLLPSQKYLLIICIFLLPSTIFFSSAIHREGLIFLSISMVVYHLFFMMKNKKYPVRNILTTLFFLLIILLIRNFVFIIMLPALIAWIVAEKNPKYSFAIFVSIYLVLGLLFFFSAYLPPSYNLPAHVSSRQLDFIKIAKRGASSININPLYPGFRSFLNNIPQALNHSFMRPYLTEHRNFLYTVSAIEILVYEIIFVLFILFRKKDVTSTPLMYFSVFLTVATFLAIGYTIPIIGAIARYRSIYFPFIIIPVVCNIDWKKIKILFII
jgi:hypothetical protein